MRRHSKKNVVLAVLLIIGGLYFISHSNFLIAGPSRPQEPIPNELTWQTERLVSKESWVEQGDYLPLNVSYQLLAGAPSTQQRYLTVGLSSVKRKKGTYLIPTLKSLFSQSSPEERSSMVVVVLLADFDVSWRVTTAREIKTAFASELEQGQLVVLHVPQDVYPPLTGVVHAGLPGISTGCVTAADRLRCVLRRPSIPTGSGFVLRNGCGRN